MGPFDLSFVMQSHGVGVTDILVQELTNLELVELHNKVSLELQRRLLSGDADNQSVGSYSVIDPPTPAASSGNQGPGGLLIPFRCGYQCKWCPRECTRREGHRYHSCFNCRRRRE